MPVSTARLGVVALGSLEGRDLAGSDGALSRLGAAEEHFEVNLAMGWVQEMAACYLAKAVDCHCKGSGFVDLSALESLHDWRCARRWCWGPSFEGSCSEGSPPARRCWNPFFDALRLQGRQAMNLCCDAVSRFALIC